MIGMYVFCDWYVCVLTLCRRRHRDQFSIGGHCADLLLVSQNPIFYIAED